MSADRTPLTIRRMQPRELDAVIRVWHLTKQVAYPYLPTEQGLTLADNDRIFRAVILPDADLWVAEVDGTVAGFMALRGSYLDRLYVLPEAQGRGLGSALLRQAKALSPGGLQLHTHVQNHQARAVYEHHGFRAVRFGVSPPPESAPDVEYHWTPASDAAPDNPPT
jgi:ribosomal protein S18 acetylase RimI-like enzyme